MSGTVVRRTGWLAPLLIAAAVAPALADDRQGTVKSPFLATADGGSIALEEGTFYVSAEVFRRCQDALATLEAGDKVMFDALGQNLVSIRRLEGATPTTGGDRRTTVIGTFESWQPANDRYYWVTVEGIPYNMTAEVYQNTPLLQWIKKGQQVRLVIRGNWVEEVALHNEEEQVDPALLEEVTASKPGDVVRVDGQTYRLDGKEQGGRALRLRPQVDGKFVEGTVVLRLARIQKFENPQARERIRQSGGGEAGGDPFAKDEIRVGDTVGIKLYTGQLIALDDERCVLREWRNERWGEEKSFARGDVTSIRRAHLTRQLSVPLPGGELHLRVHRQRDRDGLSFQIELSHDVEGALVVGAKLRLHLGGMGLEPPASGDSVEEVAVPDLFARQLIELKQNAGDDNAMDGWVEVVANGENVVKITAGQAKPHILAAIAAKPEDPDALGQVYVAAGQNGDEQLIRFLIDRALYPPGKEDGPRRRHGELAVRGLVTAGVKASHLIVGDLTLLDRNLKRTVLFRGELREELLSRLDTQPVSHKRVLARLLGQLPEGFKGDLGAKVFDLYLSRGELSQAIEEAFAQQPAAAVTTLLAVATSVNSASSNEDYQRANRATELLRRLGKSVLDELEVQLRRQNLPTTVITRGRELQGSDPGQIVQQALQLLVQDANRRRREALDATVAEAEALTAESKWGEALTRLQSVLREEPNHAGASERLPKVLLELGLSLRKEGQRGEAARVLQQALETLPAADQPRAKAPLGEMMLEAAREDVEGVVIRGAPSPAGRKLRLANPGEAFAGREVANDWIEVELGAEQPKGYVRSKLTRQASEGRYSVDATETPLVVIQSLLERARELSSPLTVQANEIEGQVLAREAEKRYEGQDYQGALVLFEQVRELAPTDPRLGLQKWCWLRANQAFIAAGFGLLLLAAGIGAMQVYARPKRVKFAGEFKHYGADRTQREREIDLGQGAGQEQGYDGGS